MKYRNFVLLWICFLLASGCGNTIFPFQKSTPLVTDQQEFSRQIEIPPNVKILEFHHRGGNITIASWEKPFILVEGVTRASAETVEMARSIIEMVQVIAYEHPQNRLVLDYESPAGFAQGKIREEGMDYTAHVPKSMLIDLKSENGSVSVSDMNYDVFIEHKGGDIRAESIRGNLTVNGTGREEVGDRITVKSVGRDLSFTSKEMAVEIAQVTGDVTIDHNSGEMLVSDVGGKLTFQGGDSLLQLTRIQGYLQINNAGGDVICDGFYDGVSAEVHDGTLKLDPKVPVTREYNCNIVKGNLIFRVPDNSNMLLELMAVNGSINSDYPLQVSAEGKVSYAKGAIGQGSPLVHLEVERGNISVLRQVPVPNSPAASANPKPAETGVIVKDPIPVSDLKSVEVK